MATGPPTPFLQLQQFTFTFAPTQYSAVVCRRRRASVETFWSHCRGRELTEQCQAVEKNTSMRTMKCTTMHSTSS